MSARRAHTVRPATKRRKTTQRGTRRTQTGHQLKLVRDMTEAELSARRRTGRKVLSEALTTVPDAYLDCYTPAIGHAWYDLVPLHPIRWRMARTSSQAKFAEETLQCERCTTQKTLRYRITRYGLERDGQPAMMYPEDYKRPGCPRGVRPSDLIMQEKFNRVVKNYHGAKGQKVAKR